MISRLVGLSPSPCLGLGFNSQEPAWDSLSLPLSAPPSLSLKINKLKKKTNKTTKEQSYIFSVEGEITLVEHLLGVRSFRDIVAHQATVSRCGPYPLVMWLLWGGCGLGAKPPHVLRTCGTDSA